MNQTGATPEPVRLIIWDLDETFWKGTLTEGGVELIPANGELVKNLAMRGIISSICSKNDYDAVKRVLEDAGIWQYFVLPSVNWEPKGPRLKSQIEAFQLRAASVMFVDDSSLQREEARFLIPDLQISDETIISHIGEMRQFEGKPDPDLVRLRQYKMLEQRAADSRVSTGDNAEFLRLCNIVVEIEHDIAAHMSRAIELINRTNQLNFTKSRLPENAAQAATKLSALLSRHDIHAGLVRVSDRYGDHGYCGIYIIQQPAKVLQFAFSCRVLGMGVERWVYQRLGRPALKVGGTEPAELNDDSPIDWINYSDRATPDPGPATERIGWIYARGGCDLQAICHYFDVGAFGTTGEFNVHRHGTDARVDHSMFLRYALSGLTADGLEACQSIGYREEDFQTKLLEARNGKVGWLLSFWSDSAYALYRHRKTGVLVPFMVPGRSNHLQDATADSVVLPLTHQDSRLAESLQYLKQHFDFAGAISQDEFKYNLRLTLDAAPPGTRIFILGANEKLWDPNIGAWHTSSLSESINQGIRIVIKKRPNVVLLNIRDFIHSDSEVHDWGHFDRMVYFRIYKEIERLMHQPNPEQATSMGRIFNQTQSVLGLSRLRRFRLNR